MPRHSVWVCIAVSAVLLGCRRPIAEKEATPAATTTAAVAAPASEKAAPAVEKTAAEPLPDNPADKFLTDKEQAEGWICLFDGHSLFGWTSNDPKINWTVEKGAITADSGPVGLLVTEVPFADFDLVCEYRMAVGGNSGIFLRSLAKPTKVPGECYEVNIADSQPEGYLTGSLVNQAKTESAILGSGDWQRMRISAEGPRIQVSLNDKQVLDFTDSDPKAPRRGLIGLQKNSGKIEFRKVVLKPRGLKPLFEQEGLSGWRVVPGSKSTFENEAGTVRVKGGEGYLETEETFQDFIFQAHSKTHAPELNSGFFFRAAPGTEAAKANGYELQIDNGVKDSNRETPKNSGTGAIFRRAVARRVVANDLEWLTTTLVTDGAKMQTWVDGYPVVIWEDKREPDENPRKGKRLEGGHISLQGHDPTTDISFRELHIVELPPRTAE